jgi:hypothetical protein
MSEVIVSGNVAIKKSGPPTIPVEMQPPTAPPEQLPDRGEGADVRLKNIGGEPIEAGEDGRGLREEVRRQKREQAAPIVEWRADAAMPPPGEHEAWAKQLKRASSSISEARLASLTKVFEEVPGANTERARLAAEFVASDPPIKVVPVGDNGQAIQPLLDDQPIRELDSFQNLAEAKRAMKNYRDAQDRSAQALADELTRQEQIERQAEQAQIQQAQVKAQEQEAARAQQAQAAHVAAAARAQQEAAALQQVRQMSLNEAELAARIQRHEQQSLQKYPEALNWEAYERTRQTNPARAAEIEREATNNRNAVAQLAKMQQDRQLREHAIGQHQAQQAAAQRQAWNEQQDAAFQNALASRHPQFSSDTGRTKLQRLAREYLEKDLGLSKQQIDAEWTRGALRSAGAQMMLADAVAHKAGKESMLQLNSKRAPVPPVQRPGTFRPAGAGALDRIADLERQLANATGNQSIKIATKLFQARREAGLTSQD